MKPNAHPEYTPTTITCACGQVYKTRSARSGDFSLDICSACHPFFTGKVKLMDTEGRVERFKNKYKTVTAEAAKKSEAKPAAEAKAAPKAEKAEKKAKKDEKKSEPQA